MGNFARVWIRIGAVARDFDFLVLTLAIHLLRVDARASCACEDLECFSQVASVLFRTGRRETTDESFLDDHSEEVIDTSRL